MIVCRLNSNINIVPTALTIGNFDGVHNGHLRIISELKENAKLLKLKTAVLIFEPQPLEFFLKKKAPARITNLKEKIHLFSKCSLDIVFVIPFNKKISEMSADEFIFEIIKKKINAREILIGDDFRFGKNRKGDFSFLKKNQLKYNFNLNKIDTVEYNEKRVSSTIIRETLSRSDFDAVKNYLGRPYSIVGKVVHGDKLGRTYGFPTANILMSRVNIPISGIFIVEIAGIYENRLEGVASVGYRPTVVNKDVPKLEVFIFDFENDLYGRVIEVIFLKKIRDELKFNKIENMIKKMKDDVEVSKLFFKTRAK